MTLPYGAIVLEHFRRPRNQRSLERPSVSHEAFNPLCGDRVRLELQLDDATIRVAAFTANACALCTASASLLTDRITGLATAEALRVSEADVLAALETDVPKAREACAVLPLSALREALAGRTRA
jgi:nitrogen fixation NifU-like protein